MMKRRSTYNHWMHRFAIGFALMVSAGLFAVPVMAQDDPVLPDAKDTKNCRLVGHSDTARFVSDDPESDYFHDGDDHRDIHGAEPDDVIFRKEVTYEFTLQGDDCVALESGDYGLHLYYETIDSPFSTTRDGFLMIGNED